MIYPTELKAGTQIGICTSMFTAAWIWGGRYSACHIHDLQQQLIKAFFSAESEYGLEPFSAVFQAATTK